MSEPPLTRTITDAAHSIITERITKDLRSCRREAAQNREHAEEAWGTRSTLAQRSLASSGVRIQGVGSGFDVRDYPTWQSSYGKGGRILVDALKDKTGVTVDL